MRTYVLLVFCVCLRWCAQDFCTDINVQVGYALQGRVDPQRRTIKTSLNVNDGATEPVPPVRCSYECFAGIVIASQVMRPR
jgi:hypothetical protein